MRAPRFLAAVMVLAAALSCGLPVSPATARQRMSFAPGDRSRPTIRMRSARLGGRHGSRSQHVARRHGRPRPEGGRHVRPETDDAGAAGVPGGGFKLENGILTYPAPARFQPKNLQHH